MLLTERASDIMKRIMENEKQYQIVAFLQNPWFKPGISQRHIEMYTNDQDFHRRVLAQSMSGKRLMQAFGEWYDRVWWDNANPVPVFQASGRQDANIYHMMGVITRVSPKIVMTVGEQAYAGMQIIEKMEHEVRLPYYIRFHCHHPNARGRTQSDLDKIAKTVIDYAINQS
jgi:hypothetical protein